MKRLDVDVNDASKVVAACCVLHNICEIHGDTFDEEWLNGTDNQSVGTNSSTSALANQKQVQWTSAMHLCHTLYFGAALYLCTCITVVQLIK